MQYPKKVVGAVCMSLFMLSCHHAQQTLISAQGNDSDSLKSIIGKKLVLPDTLEVFSSNKDSLLLDSAQLAKLSSLKIYSYLNVSCPSCIGSMSEWYKLIPAFMRLGVPVILICHSKDNFEYIKYLIESKGVKFPFPLYLDVKDKFTMYNPLYPVYDLNQVVLVDEKNIVLLKGNPRESDKIRDLYLTEIRKHQR